MLISPPPLFPVTSNDRCQDDAVGDRGGTVVLAGDSILLRARVLKEAESPFGQEAQAIICGTGQP